MKVGKPDTLPGHLVDARRLDPAIVKAHIATTQIIGQDEYNVGSWRGVTGGDGQRGQQREQQGEQRCSQLGLQHSSFHTLSSTHFRHFHLQQLAEFLEFAGSVAVFLHRE
ncbi:hypothetical protein [Novipirellula artificiosorum]|uniref:hypothetical protein n=1 Tax=Novipirellula artificiosorum TaxID=2528016 RepID=UPI001E34350D|nr:hypothetical protein [Novipirellula artificiosorum]